MSEMRNKSLLLVDKKIVNIGKSSYSIAFFLFWFFFWGGGGPSIVHQCTINLHNFLI